MDNVEHLRKINFLLIALSAGAIILAVTAKEPRADKALQELQKIRSFVQLQKEGFGSRWLRQRLLTEYGKLENGLSRGIVRSVKGEDLGSFAFVHLGFPGCLLNETTLNSENAMLIEKVLFDLDPVDTVAKWRALWDGLYSSDRQIFWVEEVMFDRAEVLIVNHRPEYQRSAFGTQGFASLLEVVKGAVPKKDLKWVWGISRKRLAEINPSKFIFLRPSANHVRADYTHAFWLLLYADPEAMILRSNDRETWNDDGFYFLHIPVRVKKLTKDLQALISREARADWQIGPFSSSFPGLEYTLGKAAKIPFDQAETILEVVADLESRSARSLRFGGFELAGAPILLSTLLVLLASQVYFLLHLEHFFKSQGAQKIDFPWLALYPSLKAKLAFMFTCATPGVAAIVIMFKSPVQYLLIVGFINTILSGFTINLIGKWYEFWGK